MSTTYLSSTHASAPHHHPSYQQLFPDNIKLNLIDRYLIGRTILDLGSANGVYSRYIHNKGLSVFSLDHDLNLLRKSEVPHLINASATHLPLRDHSVDTVLAFDILEHLPQTALSQVYRVTRRRLIGTVPRLTDVQLNQAFLLFGHHVDTTHLRTYTKKSLKSLLTKYHFTHIRIFASHPIPVDTLYYNLFSAHPILIKIVRKLTYLLLHRRVFYSNLSFVADIGPA